MSTFLKTNSKAAVSLSVLALVLFAPAALAATVSVKSYGAKGDGVADDTAAIQRAVNAVQGSGGTVIVPPGTYMINTSYNSAGGKSGILLRGAMTFQLDAGATLQAKTTTLHDYYVISILSANNVKIVGSGTVKGDRLTHVNKRDFGGMALGIQSSTNITVDGPTFAEATGDGVIIRNNATSTKLDHITSRDNGRQGLSIISGRNLSVLNSTFKNTRGLNPECGIDVEPDNGFTVDQVLIQNNVLTNNDGCGISLTVAPRDISNTRVTNVTIDGNTVTANGRSDGIWQWGTGININHVHGAKVTNNVITSNYGEAIMLGYKNGTDDRPARSTLVTGNHITNQLKTPSYPYRWSGGGIYLWSASNSTIANNTVTNNAGNGIVGPTTGTMNGGDASISISGNTVNSNGATP